jgi:hypothetical protein
MRALETSQFVADTAALLAKSCSRDRLPEARRGRRGRCGFHA